MRIKELRIVNAYTHSSRIANSAEQRGFSPLLWRGWGPGGFSPLLWRGWGRLSLLALSFLVLQAAAATQRTPRYQRADSLRVVQLLTEARQQPRTTCWPLYFGRQLIGLPYVAHTLEDNPGEQQLIVNLRELDCTTLTENVVALTLCARAEIYTFAAFLENLETIRYFKNQTFEGYPARLHYFCSWMADNEASGIVKETTGPNPPFTAVQHLKVNYMSTHPDRYAALKAAPELIPDIRRAEQMLTGQSARYIPKAQLTNTPLLRETIHDGDIIVIITNIAGLDTQHIGLAAWHADGLHLLNASSIHHKVVEEPMTLRQYLYRHKTMPGIRVLRIQ